ncbi:MAG: DUF808 domain-containing protein [Fimbriimonas sp.]
MPGSSFFALFDDIASILDDVAAMTKVATKKTAGVLGDDLALNAQQVTGVVPDRELPVVWAVAKGSLVNKVILVPSALAISAFAPAAVTPLLMFGGAFLCFEGCEKIVHKFLHPKEDHHEAPVDEQAKIKGAIRTDFILSAEIITISLGTVTDKPLGTQVGVLVAIALIMTVGVYGLVAAIVKLDDAGLRLLQSGRALARSTGAAILRLAPILMRALSVLGTAAMFMVGGGILTHGIHSVGEVLHDWAHKVEGIPVISVLASPILDGVFGLLVGAVIVLAWTLVSRLLPKKAANGHA